MNDLVSANVGLQLNKANEGVLECEAYLSGMIIAYLDDRSSLNRHLVLRNYPPIVYKGDIIVRVPPPPAHTHIYTR